MYPESCRTEPWPHQIERYRLLRERPAFALFDDVGFGKSKSTVDAICGAWHDGKIDAVIVVAPGGVLSVWGTDPLLSGLTPHVWENVPYSVHVWGIGKRSLVGLQTGEGAKQLPFVVTNYEFIRRWQDPRKRLTRPQVLEGKGYPHLEPLIAWARARKVWLVLDEGWSVENSKAAQTRACWLLRQACARVTILNGTPGKMEKQFSQFQILNPSILGLSTFAQFRNHYLVMGGHTLHKGKSYERGAQVVGYRNVEEFQARTKDYAIRKDDGLGLPPVLPPQTIEARLSDAEWAAYTAMRDEMVVWLDANSASAAAQAGVKSTRLLQILAGYVGGVEVFGEDGTQFDRTRVVGSAKLDAVLAFDAAHPLHRLVVWCRFKEEMDRMAASFSERGYLTVQLRGGQSAEDRATALRTFAPNTDESRDARLVGHPAAGGAGVTLAKSAVGIYTSSFALKDLLQSRGRLNRPGQTAPVRFYYLVAVGPKGQKTLDHALVTAHTRDEDIAHWTAAHWRRALTEA